MTTSRIPLLLFVLALVGCVRIAEPAAIEAGIQDTSGCINPLVEGVHLMRWQPYLVQNGQLVQVTLDSMLVTDRYLFPLRDTLRLSLGNYSGSLSGTHTGYISYPFPVGHCVTFRDSLRVNFWK